MDFVHAGDDNFSNCYIFARKYVKYGGIQI